MDKIVVFSLRSFTEPQRFHCNGFIVGKHVRAHTSAVWSSILSSLCTNGSDMDLFFRYSLFEGCNISSTMSSAVQLVCLVLRGGVSRSDTSALILGSAGSPLCTYAYV